MGQILTPAHASARPACEAQAQAADDALFATVRQALRKTGRSDILKRMHGQADRLYQATDALYPDNAGDYLTEEENEVIATVFQAADQLRVSLALLAEFAESRENPPRAWGREL